MNRTACITLGWMVFAVMPADGLAQSARELSGTFISLEARDPHAISRNAGVEFSFADGQYRMTRDGEARVIGQYAIHADTVLLTDTTGAWACLTQETSTARYSWRTNADRLELTLVGQDACNRRRNRLAGAVLIRGRAPTFAPTVQAPTDLRESWEKFWNQSDIAGWIDQVFMRDALAEDGNRRLSGIEEIRQWLGGQDSRDPQAFPFEFSRSSSRIIEKGRYRDVFGAADGSTRVLVGRYQITWVPASGSAWKVQEWILK